MAGIKPGSVAEFRMPAGPDGGAVQWTKATVVRLVRAGSHRHVEHTVLLERCINIDTVVLTRSALKRARRHNRVWRSGLSRPGRTTTRERVIVSPKTFDHLKDWVFNTGFVETLKASEQNQKRGHCFGLKETPEATYPRYARTR